MTTTAEPVRRAQPAAWRAAGRRSWIDVWEPEDALFWENTGRRVAQRNLMFSVFSEHIGFSIWTIWSVIVLFLGPEYGIDPAGKFVLTAVPALVGALLRFPYTLAVAKFGGRNWTIVSTALLLIPTTLIAIVLEPGVSYATLVVVAAFGGVGGGNFASSMANINWFYPDRFKGRALGINAGGGNLGVPVVQLVGLVVLATLGTAHPRALVAIYVPLILLAGLCAATQMDNLSVAKNSRRALRDVARQGHAWVMSLLYIGTFGSFIGYSFAFGLVLQIQFAEQFSTPVKAASLTFIGPLLGSLIRPVGGILADRFGGARVTFWNFVAMGAAASVVLYASLAESLPWFLVGFIALFVFSGLGNGSTYKMIPAIFRAKAQLRKAEGADVLTADHVALTLSGALIGAAGAIGAFGGVAVNLAFRQSFLSHGEGTGAYIAFIAFYVVCVAVTWTVYLRPSSRRLVGV